MKYDAFISYRREGGFLMAQLIRDRLEARGVRCYMDLEEAKAGKFDESLLEAIAEAPNFILILPKKALDRCVNPEDWVRREIEAAVRSEPKKTIIPIRYPDFVWPKKLHPQLPEEIRQLETQKSVLLSQEYLSATIDRILSFLQGAKAVQPQTGDASIPQGTVPFFRYGLEKFPPDRVDLAFHAGAEWRQNSAKLDILSRLLAQGTQVRVLVNEDATVRDICRHMQQPLKKYVGFDSCVADWLELARDYPSLQVRIASVPMLHRLYLIRDRQGNGAVSIKFYTYGNYTPDKDHRQCFESPSPEFRLFAEEFDYLWERARED